MNDIPLALANPDDPTSDAAVLLELEQPQAGTIIHADETLVGYGWALAPTPILGIAVDLDGEALCVASTGLARIDVAEMYPDHPEGARSGFTFVTALPPHAAGHAQLRLTIRTESGEQVHAVALEIAGDAAAQPAPPPPPPPAPDRQDVPAGLEPIRLALEEARFDAAGRLHVRGWAVAAREVRDVEVFYGDRTIGFADTGLSRADVGQAFPAYPNAMLSGIALTMALPADRIGAENVTIVVTDRAGETLSATRQAHGRPHPAPSEAAAPGPAPAPAPALAPLLVTLEEARVNELGQLRVRGWAIGLAAIEQVRVFAGDEQIGVAAHNIPRDDVGNAHPEYPNAAMAGFLLQVEVPDERLVGSHVRVVVSAMGNIRREASGLVTAAPVVRRREQVAPEIHFHCDLLSLTEDGALYLKGWAVCPSGTTAIDVDLGDEALGQAELGDDRPDVGHHFPSMPGARTAGFRFLGRSMVRREGEHIARLTVRGRDGESRVVLLPVLAQPEETMAASTVATAESASAGIRFFLDTPAVADGRATETVRGFLSINGWAFSPAGLTGIEVFVDGRSQGQAYRGIRREDLYKVFAQKEALRAGFAMLVPPQVLKQGRHDLRVVIRDGAGHTEDIAFTVEAEPSMEGPGPWSLRTKIKQSEADLGLSLLAAAGYAPEWTILLPPAGTPATQAKKLRATLESLRWQAFPGWTAVLPVATKAERKAWQTALAEEVADLGTRLRLVVAAAETPLADLAAAGTAPRLIALLAPGDLLGEDALLELSIAAAAPDRPDFLYGDERRVDPADGTTRAFFKPDWSPDLLLSTNYIGRPWAAAPHLLTRAGALLGDIARHGEYDLTLRLTEQARGIAHVAKTLCARGARALDTPAEERRALQRALTRRGIAADIKPGAVAGTYRIQRTRAGDPLVSIIIPTVAARGLIETAITSIRAKTGYRNYEIVCLDNIAAGEDAGGDGWKAWLKTNADVVLEIPARFNWSRFNNLGAAAASGDVLLFLNDDIEVIEPDWLDALLEQALRPEVGAVGPQLLYPDGKVQHAGMFLSRSVGRHAFRFLSRDDAGPFGLALTQRNVIAVTGACLMTRRDVFEALGGFDEEHAVINNDLDFCLRARAAGRAVIYTPHATLIHHEMISRGEIKDTFNTGRFMGAWKDLFLTGDPYFNPNLSPDYDDYVPEEEPVRTLRIGHPVIARDRVRRILALKLDHIGDFVSAFPAFRRLKERFPNAELTVLAARASLALAPLEPAIDRVIQFDYFHTRSDKGRRAIGKKDFARLHEQLAPFRFDLAVDLRRQPETRHVLQHAGARWLAGFDVENRTEWLDIAVEWEGDVARTHKRTHISEALVQFVDAIAVACETDRRIIRDAPRAAEGRTLLAALPDLALGSGPLVCVHAGAGSENKEWPLANFAGLIDLLVGRDNATVIAIGGPEEEATVARLLALTRERVVSVVNRFSLRQLPAVLAACDLYVGNDSGPKHIAASLGVPTVGIHAGSVDTVEWGPLGPSAVAIRRAMTCSPCYLAKVGDCHRGLACLTGIGVGDVYRQCRRMLGLSPGSPAIALAAVGP
jgi:ADP-heptose:LPS heptosyltransferase/GT2 family glycosyltransferase